MFTVRTMFHHCLINLSPNRWRPIDEKNGADTMSILAVKFVWPDGATDELGLILFGKVKKPRNYFYTFCKLKPYSLSSKSAGDQEGSTNTPWITVGADNRLICDAGIIHIVEESLSESTSLSKEIDEYMDMRSFMQNV